MNYEYDHMYSTGQAMLHRRSTNSTGTVQSIMFDKGFDRLLVIGFTTTKFLIYTEFFLVFLFCTVYLFHGGSRHIN